MRLPFEWWEILFIVALVLFMGSWAVVAFTMGFPSMAEASETYYDTSIKANVTKLYFPWIPAGSLYANTMGTFSILTIIYFLGCLWWFRH